MDNNYQQLILFGSPGTGKSYQINKRLKELGIEDSDGANCIKTVFHPEYTYGDFVGKLLPLTNSKGGIEYHYYSGHFLRALAQAYKNILDNPENPKPVALVIDEINRGNSAAIFGTMFQLLDRESDGWSSYGISISKMEFGAILKLLGYKFADHQDQVLPLRPNEKAIDFVNISNIGVTKLKLEQYQIRIPSNLSIFATMNTSDTSIYYMDSAFKRRWEWEFVPVKNGLEDVGARKIEGREAGSWVTFVDKLNQFIRNHAASIRGVEDKQIGYFFINDETIARSKIQNKVMFFLWDSVFARDKKPLADLLNQKQFITFGDFAKLKDEFIGKILDLKS